MLRLANTSYGSKIKIQRTQLRLKGGRKLFSSMLVRGGGTPVNCSPEKCKSATERGHLKLISTVSFRSRQMLREQDL